MSKHGAQAVHHFNPTWWELVSYLILIAVAAIFIVTSFSRWVIAPLLVAVFMVCVARSYYGK